MDKMRMESIDMTEQNIEKIGDLFPNCITETKDAYGRPKKAINFDLLRQMLSRDVIEGDEAYEFTWVGKKAAIVEANKPIRKTLRPCKEESVNWDNTENLYIEGDNLEVLKLLQESYLGKVRVIYIDPPYNTGSDRFVYNDNFTSDKDVYEEQIELFDDEGNRRFCENNISNPRFHSDWCSMMYSRLMLARNLLADEGAIFISTDDNEADNLKKICDEIFGASCFVSNVSWQRTYSTRNDSTGIVNEVEHIIIYSKLPGWSPRKLPRTAEMNSIYKNPDNDQRAWTSSSVTAPGAVTHQGMVYAIQHPFTGELMYPTTSRCWSLGQSQMLENLQQWCGYELRNLNDEEKRARVCGIEVKDVRKDVKGIVLTKPLEISRKEAQAVMDRGNWPYFYFTNGGKGGIRRKTYLDDMGGRLPTNFWPFTETGHTDEAKKEVKALFDGNIPFDTPKPTRLIDRILEIASDENGLILDFFSGSSTTAHSVMKKNAEESKKMHYILVQIREESKSPLYPSLCEVGLERIRRAAKKIAEEHPDAKFDGGFRVFKLDDTNMKDVYYAPADYQQNFLDQLESNIKEDRTDLDLLFGCLLEWGLPLSLPYQSESIDGCTVHNYNDGDLIACFDENIPDSVIKAIAKRQPLRAVFRDSSFTGSPAKINVTQIFKELAPDTSVKVL